MAAPRSKKATVPTAVRSDEPAYDDWDLMVAESKVAAKPYRIRRVVDGEEQFVTIPCPSGASYINLSMAQARVDVAGILVNLTTSGANDEENGQLFSTLMDMLGQADFPVVDLLASRVLTHYFNPAPKAADGSAGGPGESAAS